MTVITKKLNKKPTIPKIHQCYDGGEYKALHDKYHTDLIALQKRCKHDQIYEPRKHGDDWTPYTKVCQNCGKLLEMEEWH